MLEKLTDIILDYVDTDPALITEEASLRYDIGATSFDLMNISVAIEKEFKVKIPDSKIPVMKNIGDLIKVIEEVVNI